MKSNKSNMVSFRVTNEEKKELENFAKQYLINNENEFIKSMNVNMSDVMRYAVFQYVRGQNP